MPLEKPIHKENCASNRCAALFMDKLMSAASWIWQRVGIYFDEHRLHYYVVDVSICRRVVILAGDQRQPWVILVFERRGVAGRCDLVAAHFINVVLVVQVDDHLVPILQGVQVDEWTGRAIGHVDVPGNDRIARVCVPSA